MFSATRTTALPVSATLVGRPVRRAHRSRSAVRVSAARKEGRGVEGAVEQHLPNPAAVAGVAAVVATLSIADPAVADAYSEYLEVLQTQDITPGAVEVPTAPVLPTKAGARAVTRTAPGLRAEREKFQRKERMPAAAKTITPSSPTTSTTDSSPAVTVAGVAVVFAAGAAVALKGTKEEEEELPLPPPKKSLFSFGKPPPPPPPPVVARRSLFSFGKELPPTPPPPPPVQKRSPFNFKKSVPVAVVPPPVVKSRSFFPFRNQPDSDPEPEPEPVIAKSRHTLSPKHYSLGCTAVGEYARTQPNEYTT